MLDGTYAGLQASVGDFLNRADLTSVIPDFIRMAESQINRTIRCADMMVSTTLTINSAVTALPSDFNGMVSFELPSGSGNPLRYEKPEGVRAKRQTMYASPGTPIEWTVIGTNLETAPSPSQAFGCPMVYYGRLPALTNSNTSNWLLTKHPDAYLYGSLLQSAPYLKDDPRLEVWGSLYRQVIADINASDGRVSFGHGMIAPFRSAAAPEGTSPQPAPPALPAPQ